jgi:hypothetical protein
MSEADCSRHPASAHDRMPTQWIENFLEIPMEAALLLLQDTLARGFAHRA